MSYTLVLEWMPGDLYMSAVTARCTAPTSSYSVVWLPPNKVYQITLYCGSTSLVSFLVGAFRGKAWSYMKKEIFYLIGAVAGALLVLLAVPLGNAYIGNYLSVYGGMDTQSYVLLMQSAVTGFQILGGVLLGLFGAAYLFRRKP